MIIWIHRIGRTRIYTEHPFHSTYDASYGASYDCADGSSSLIADRGAMGDPPWNSLGLGGGRQRKRYSTANRYNDV
jgi:hypothetical protein